MDVKIKNVETIDGGLSYTLKGVKKAGTRSQGIWCSSRDSKQVLLEYKS
jgi:hypothetical protein